MNLLVIIYVSDSKAQITPLESHLEIFNEVTIISCTLHLVCFTDYIDDVDMQYAIGWSMLSILFLNIFIFMSVIIYKSLF